MISVLINLIVLLVVGGLLWYLLQLLPLPDPVKTVIQVCCILILILVILGFAFGGLDIGWRGSLR